MPLSRYSVGTSPEMSSHATCQGTVIHSRLTEPLWTDPGLKSGISVLELISTSKKKKKVPAGGMNGRTFSPNPRKWGKSHHIIQYQKRQRVDTSFKFGLRKHSPVELVLQRLGPVLKAKWRHRVVEEGQQLCSLITWRLFWKHGGKRRLTNRWVRELESSFPESSLLKKVRSVQIVEHVIDFHLLEVSSVQRYVVSLWNPVLFMFRARML